MVKLSHDFNFLDQALFSIFFTVGGLLREGFDCIILMIVKFLDQIHRSKISLSDFFDRFELLMKTFLVQVIFQDLLPLRLVLVG